MSDPQHPRPDDEDDGHAADQWVAKFLADNTSGVAKERRRAHEEAGEHASDVIGRLNALEFVGSLVGDSPDMPESLGEYRITGLLGRGGMGTVYEAFQESLEREVAIKVLSPTFAADLTMRKRFRAEAKLTASLHHQHIVPIYDYGEVAGYLFFAMEKVDGISLDKHISAARRRGGVVYEPREAAHRFAGVADALGHAHKRMLLHRDVKPGNILVTADGTLALADFGLSKVLSGGGGEASAHLTTQGGFLGTLHYASPEQALGRELTPASDLFALGVTIFECVTGELPRQGKNTEALLQAILQEEPLRLRHLLKDAPKDLDAVLFKLLQRDPGDRYPDGSSLAADLRRVGDGDPVQIRRQPLLQRIWRRARRNPGVAAATVVAAGLLLVTALMFFGMLEARRESRISRHEALLSGAVTHARVDAGAAAGRFDRIAALTGVFCDVAPPPTRVLEDLADAADLEPADPRPSRMRDAYVVDPVPELAAKLAEGRGYAVERGIAEVIDVELKRSSTGQQDADFTLFELYVLRAVARLTESVGDAAGARADLLLAGFLRPGSFHVKVLALAAELAAGGRSADVATLIQRAERLVAEAPVADTQAAETEAAVPTGGREVLGQLLQCASGLVRPPDANLMRIDLAHSDRVRLLHAGRALWAAGVQYSVSVEGHSNGTGLERSLVAQARRGLTPRGDRFPQAAAAAATGLRSVEQVIAPGAPMQRWWAAFQILREPLGSRAILDEQNNPVPPAVVLDGFDLLLALEPPGAWLEQVRSRLEGVCAAHRELDLAVQVMARFQSQRAAADASRVEDAVGSASAWVARMPDEPRALWCRAKTWLRLGNPLRALDDATRAIQLAPERPAAVRRAQELLGGGLEALPEGDPRRVILDDAMRALEEFS